MTWTQMIFIRIWTPCETRQRLFKIILSRKICWTALNTSHHSPRAKKKIWLWGFLRNAKKRFPSRVNRTPCTSSQIWIKILMSVKWWIKTSSINSSMQILSISTKSNQMSRPPTIMPSNLQENKFSAKTCSTTICASKMKSQSRKCLMWTNMDAATRLLVNAHNLSVINLARVKERTTSTPLSKWRNRTKKPPRSTLNIRNRKHLSQLRWKRTQPTIMSSQNSTMPPFHTTWNKLYPKVSRQPLAKLRKSSTRPKTISTNSTASNRKSISTSRGMRAKMIAAVDYMSQKRINSFSVTNWKPPKKSRIFKSTVLFSPKCLVQQGRALS